MMKTAIFGGTFNPIHNGHLHIAESALDEFGLDKAIFIPTGISYMKQGVLSSYHRLNMTRLATEGNNRFEVSDIEVKRKGYTYTKDTVKYFKDNFHEYELYFVIGTDTLFMLEKWKEPEVIFDNMIILVADRQNNNSIEKANELKKKYNAKIEFMNCSFWDISSSMIRSNIYKKEGNVSGLLPEKVYNYICENNLYSSISVDEMIDMLKVDLKPTRLTHTFGVRDLALKLASVYNVDLYKAEVSALLHDCAKYMPFDEKINLCEQYNQEVSEFEKNNDALLHAKAGACLSIEKYHVFDEEIFNAIKYHTTGRPDMTLLEKIIFLSDYCEVNRTHSDKLPYYRELALTEIDKCVALILKDTLDYLRVGKTNEGAMIDPMTNESFEFYKKYI